MMYIIFNVIIVIILELTPTVIMIRCSSASPTVPGSSTRIHSGRQSNWLEIGSSRFLLISATPTEASGEV